MLTKSSEKARPNTKHLRIQDLKRMMDRIIESIWGQNRDVFDFHEQVLLEIEKIKEESLYIQKELGSVSSHMEKMKKDKKEMRRLLGEKDDSMSDNASLPCMGKMVARMDELEKNAEYFRQMGMLSERMLASIGSVAAFLGGTLSSLSDNFKDISRDLSVNERIINTHEAERLRMSRELHDTVAQDLASVLFDISICRKLAELGKKDDVISELDKIRNKVQGSISGIRQVIFDMRPMSLDDLGLIGAIFELSQSTASRYGLKIKITSVDKDSFPKGTFPVFKNIAIYRIVQESLNNITHHSEATRINMSIDISEEAFTITVQDDGHGFDIKKVLSEQDNTTPHFGILGMIERARQIASELSIDSELGKGTTVRLRCPLE